VPPVTGDPITPAVQMMDYESLKGSHEEGLHHFYKQLLAQVDTWDIITETITDVNDTAFEINELCDNRNVELVIMGTNNEDGFTQTLLGSDALDMAKDSTVPVLIVPADCTFRPAKN